MNKLTLEDLKVESFITTIEGQHIRGGVPTGPAQCLRTIDIGPCADPSSDDPTFVDCPTEGVCITYQETCPPYNC